jgi:hypothetical protein
MQGMSGKTDEVASILRRLQAFVRRPPSGGRTVRTARVPDDIATEDCQWLCLEPDEEQAYGQAQALLLGDLRFEYLEQREAADALWRFVCQCHVDRAHDHVVSFIAEHAREIPELTCYLPVEYLEVEAETDIAGLCVLPTTADEIPQQGRRFVLEPPVSGDFGLLSRDVRAVFLRASMLRRMQRGVLRECCGIAGLRAA